jgi:hypothetical protein
MKINFYSAINGNSMFNLWDAGGILVFRKNIQVVAGLHSETIDLRNFNTGVYILKINKPDGAVINKKIVKAN